MLTASTVTYNESEHCPIRLYEPGAGLIAWGYSILGAVLEAAHAYGVRLTTYMITTKNDHDEK